MSDDLGALKRLAKKYEGVKVWEASPGHLKVQREGRAVVNYWPNSKNRTAHMDGTPKGVVRCDPADVIAMAYNGPKAVTTAAQLSKEYSRKPAGERISRNEYAFRGADYDEKAAAIQAQPKQEGPPWR